MWKNVDYVENTLDYAEIQTIYNIDNCVFPMFFCYVNC